MVKGVGIDIIEVARIKSMMEKYGDKFFKRILTDNEINYCSRFQTQNCILPAGLRQKKRTASQSVQAYQKISDGKILKY